MPVIVYLSEAYLVAGRLEEARQHAVQALDLARQRQYRGHQAGPVALGESTARLAYPESEPADYYRQALALAEARAHSRRTATTASARCMPQPGIGNWPTRRS